MSTIKIDYRARLPYGYWFDPETGMEHLFDRGYCAIASRPVAEPHGGQVHRKRRHISCPVEVYFYSGSSPDQESEMRARCEEILSRFILGLDIRGFLETDWRHRVPETGGAYVPEDWGQTEMSLRELEDLFA